jgi:hypothetical protein
MSAEEAAVTALLRLPLGELAEENGVEFSEPLTPRFRRGHISKPANGMNRSAR